MGDSGFYIVDHFDAPNFNNIAAMSRKGSLYYLNKKSLCRSGMSAEMATPIEKFGIKVEQIGRGQFRFTRSSTSTATYKDGLHRPWQGPRRMEMRLEDTMLAKQYLMGKYEMCLQELAIESWEDEE